MTALPRCTTCGRALKWRLILAGPDGQWTHYRELPPTATPHAVGVPDELGLPRPGTPRPPRR